MTIPKSVYQTAKVAEDFSASKQSVDQMAMFRCGVESGKSVFKQLGEYFRLSRGPGKLELKDYYLYRLYDDAKYTYAQKQEFVSERFYFDIVSKCCDPRWWILADDKFWAYTILQANGFAVPETQAVYCGGVRVFGSVPTLTDPNQLDQFLTGEARYPLYAKPVNGIGSFGNYLISGYQAETLTLHDGAEMALDRFVAEIDATNGQLFQTTLTSHKDLADVCGRVSTVRVILILREGEFKLLHTVWKIPAAENMADNFWRNGNRLAAIDVNTGRVQQVVAHREGAPHELDPQSPDAASLIGRQLPDWAEVLETCRRGAKIFAPLRFQSWDIALTDNGPVVVEFNPGSAFNLSQLATGRGFLTEEFLEFLTDCGVKLKPRDRVAGRG